MNISNINSELKFANRIGQTLSTEEKISLESSVLKLSYQYSFEEFNLWGRVEGIIKNYYIVQGVSYKGATNFPTKKYFWSSQDFKFAELPAFRHEFIPKVKQMNDFFTGQHQKILLKSTEENKKLINVHGEDLVVKSKSFTELDRLSIIVHLISQDCQVVPLGAFKMIPTHELIRNLDFRGLKIDGSKNLDNYVHLRPPSHTDKKILIECDKALEREDFMDPLSQDPIKKSWSVQSDESKTEVTLRSLLWPGYVAYHRTNSTTFGGVYMGTGIRSQDLEFII